MGNRLPAMSQDGQTVLASVTLSPDLEAALVDGQVFELSALIQVSPERKVVGLDLTAQPVEPTRVIDTEVERIGYLCIQGYPNRICGGCTSACREPVFAHPETVPGTSGPSKEGN